MMFNPKLNSRTAVYSFQPHWTTAQFPLRGSVALHEISTNYQDTKQPHITQVSTSNVLRCKYYQKKNKFLLGDVTICSHNVAQNTENDLLNLARPARGSRAVQTSAHELFFCNKDNVSHITRHLQSHHSDRFI